MPYYSEESKRRLNQAHHLIQRVGEEVIQVVDVKVGETLRGREKQQRYYREGKSKLQYPDSKHNRRPAEAVHFLPYPELWDASTERWYYVGGIVVGVAQVVLPSDVGWRWGGDWDGDDIFSDQGFDDLAHHELVLP